MIQKKVRALLSFCGISQKELAEKMGKSASALNSKIRRETLTVDELHEIARICGCAYEFGFIFPNGDRI